MAKILNPYLENIHAYNGKLHDIYTTCIYNIAYDSFADVDTENMLAGYVPPDELVKRARDIVFNFDYGIIKETIENKYIGSLNLKDSFEEAFIAKYLTDEISYESFTLWQTKLRGKLLEVVPVLNLQYNMFKELELADLRGGYKYTETIDNTHSDTDTVKDTTSNTRKNNGTSTSGAITSDFPVNEVDDLYNDNLKDVDWASGGSAVRNKNDSTTTDNGTLNGDRKNNGEYQTNRNATREDRNLIDNILKIKKAFNTLITETLYQFDYLFLGIM